LVLGLWSSVLSYSNIAAQETSKTEDPRPKTFPYAKLAAMDRRQIPLATLVISSVLSVSCATSLFKVKPATELPPLPANSTNADAGGVTIRVAPLLTDEESQELFEANLPVSGILPVRLELSFQSGVPVELKRARFSVRDSQNRAWKLLTTKKAVSRILKANGVFAYNPHSRKLFESDFGAYVLDTETPLDSNQSRRGGFLFFQTPDKRPVEYGQKLTLVVERLPQTASIPLN
jgi:hypothetical protein